MLSLATVYRDAAAAGLESVPVENPMRAKLQDVVANGLESAAAKDAQAKASAIVDRIGRYVSKSPFVTGDAVSLGDTSVLPYVLRLELLNLGHLWSSQPAILEWLGLLRDRPSFAAAISKFSGTAVNVQLANYGCAESLVSS